MKTGLINEYKTLTAICSITDYGDKASVKKHNQLIDRMQEIVEEIGYELTSDTPEQFVKLLDITENKTNLWAAIHILERLPIDRETEQKAINIIEIAAMGESADAMGFQSWLDDWNENHKK